MKLAKKAFESFANHLKKENHSIPWVLLIGEEGSGKTTALYYLLSSNRDKYYPDTVLNWIDISYGQEWFKLIDLGKEILKDESVVDYFISIADGLVYVINGESQESLKKSIEPFHAFVEKIPSNIPLLVLVNKKNPENNINLNDVLSNFDLGKISSPNDPRSFHFEICIIHTGEGLYRGFDWFVSKLIAYEGYHEIVSIHRVLIYDVNGLLNFDAQFSEISDNEHDAVLITGLLSALNSMTRTLFKESSFLDVVTVGDYSMVLVTKQQKICCLFVERGGAIGKAKQIAEMILDIYLEEGENGRLAIENLIEESKHKDEIISA
ncbi:MAG TPA: ADP-ribosylation factor-like protein [candidate division Zixibacteria bacterium]|nr:ADP-ribosylation factor-like protein [candidate division Zixibacteria bacterium]